MEFIRSELKLRKCKCKITHKKMMSINKIMCSPSCYTRTPRLAALSHAALLLPETLSTSRSTVHEPYVVHQWHRPIFYLALLILIFPRILHASANKRQTARVKLVATQQTLILYTCNYFYRITTYVDGDFCLKTITRYYNVFAIVSKRNLHLKKAKRTEHGSSQPTRRSGSLERKMAREEERRESRETTVADVWRHVMSRTTTNRDSFSNFFQDICETRCTL